MQFLKNASSIVASLRHYQPFYDPHLGVVINDAKFRVRLSGSFTRFRIHKNFVGGTEF